jgi:flagellar hook assembly protein FlgD
MNPSGAPIATIVIYDAVGNVVFRSKPSDITVASDGNTFGFVWDGKNMSGRTVGPGTYLVKIVGTQTDGSKFGEMRKVGVTTDGNVKR